MIAFWMLYCLAIGALLSLGALAMERAMRAFRRPQRWIWAAAMVLAMALPAAARWLPRAPEPVFARTAMGVAGAGAGAARMQVDGPPPAAVESKPRFDVAALDWPLAFAWMGMTTVSLLALFAAWVVLERRRRGWRAAEVDGVPVLLSPATGPAVIGLFRSRIVLPAWVVADADPAVRALLLEHEREHVDAGDPRLLALGLITVAAMPWNPAAWWMLRRLRLAVEVDCDARVLARRGDVRAYGTLLLEVGRRGTGGRLMAAAFSEPRSFLERRIRIMSQRMQRPRARSLFPVLAVCAASLLAMRALPAPAVPVPARAKSAIRGDTVPPVLANAEAVIRALQQQYPPLLRDAGVQGTASVRMRVTAQGSPADARVVQASHPEFGEAAVRAISVMRFQPARSGGSAVEFTLVMPFQFSLDGGDAWPPVAEVPAGPPAWDRPPSVVNVEELVRAFNDEYPPLLRDAGITARVQVQVRISATGAVEGVQALSSTHPEAVPAAERVMARARFRPARKDGQPVAAEVVMPVEFRAPGAGQP